MNPPDSSDAPSAEQRLLLRAALASGSSGLMAWEEWLGRVDFDEIDPESMRLIPQVAMNLKEMGVEHALLGRMWGIRRYWWSRGQAQLRRFAAVLDDLRAASIDPMALGGVALCLSYYRDPGLRPLLEFDLMVRSSEARKAVSALLGAGWRTEPWVRVRSSDDVDTRARAGLNLVAVDGHRAHLRWHMFSDCRWGGVDEPVWQRAAPLDVLGRQVHAPQASDLLADVCVRGATGAAASRVQWLSDAAILLRAAGAQIDWDRLIDEADRRLLLLVFKQATAQLRDWAGVEIPDGARRRLARARVSWAERREFNQRRAGSSYDRSLAGRWCQLTRRHPDKSLFGRALRVPAYIHDTWSLPSLGHVPLFVVSRTASRLRNRLSSGA